MSSTPRWQRPLLPGELREDPDGRRSARDWIVDLVMFLTAACVGVAVLADSWDAHGAGMGLADVALGLIALVALWWRRSRPDAVGAVATAASICSGLAAGPALVAGFNVALRGSRRGILVVIGLSAAGVALFPLIYPPGDGYLLNVLVGALLIALVLGWGLFARARRQHVLALHERAGRLEAEQRLRVEQAREAERRRIAREMHDVLAHRVSLLALHAGALEFRPDAPSEEVAEAAGVIRANAHAALEELRGVIGMLRDSGDGSAPEPPQPTLGDIPALVEESRAAGMRVALRLDAPGAEGAPAAVGRTAFRVVQEGLTNARKHAPGAAVTVAVAGHDELVVEVATRPAVGVAVGAPARPPGAGSGLVGLAERVALAGGALEHGRDATGDFVVRARLPWAP